MMFLFILKFQNLTKLNYVSLLLFLIAVDVSSFSSRILFKREPCWSASSVLVVPESPSFVTSELIFSKNDNNKLNQKMNYRSLTDTTQKLLNSTTIGCWNRRDCDEVERIVEVWAGRQSRKAALEVEKLLQRIIKEQQIGNPYADAVDMTALYTNLIKGWANSGDPVGAERAEEILDYLQQLEEENDSYDPLLCGPCLESFNAVISAYARSDRHDAPEQAIRVLGKLYDWIRQGRTLVEPNKETYAYVLRAFVKKSSPNSPALVLSLLRHMDSLSKKYPSVKPDVTCHNVYIYALHEATTGGYLNKTESAKTAYEHLEMMIRDPDKDISPNTWSFNMVLNAWSRSGSPDMVDQSERLLQQMESYYEQATNGVSRVQPNSHSYNTVLSCYSRSTLKDKLDRAEYMFQKMKALYTSGKNRKAKPDSITYNIMMNMFAKAKRRNSPLKVEYLLHEMAANYAEFGDTKLRPTTRSINTCLDAWALSGRSDAAEKISGWIQKMKHSATNSSVYAVPPDKWSYNSYLMALARSGKDDMATKAEKVLLEMEQLHASGVRDVKPDVLTFTNVIHCIALSGKSDAEKRAMAILNRMEDLHEQGFGDIMPNLFTYNCVINTIAKSKRKGKAKLALSILRRMEEVSLRPVLVSYNNVLNACAFSNQDDEDKATVLEIALQMLSEAQNGPGANWISYQTAIRVISNFVDDPQLRWEITQEILNQCCKDGQLTKTVLDQVRFTVTPEQYMMLKEQTVNHRTNRIIDKYSVNAIKSMRSRMTRMVPT